MAQNDKKAPVIDKESSSSEIARRFKANPGLFIGTVIVLVLVIVSFVLVPAIVPESSGGPRDLTFGYYDKVPINWVSGNYFARRYNEIYQEITRYAQAQGITIGDFEHYYIWNQAFQDAAMHTAILQEIKRSNYAVPEKTVNQEVAKLPQFQENGSFSLALYRQRPESDRLVLWRQVQDSLAENQYYECLKGLLKSSGEADFFGKMSSNMRRFDMVSFQVDDYPESEYAAYAGEYPDLFSTIHLSRISVSSGEREAKRVLDSIKDGTAAFEDAARAQSQDGYKDSGGDMGIRLVYEIEQEITDANDRQKILNLEKGELSDIVRVGGMWVFFRVEDELKRANFEDDAVMERVRSYVRNFQRGRMEDWAIAQARNFIADVESYGFEEAARSLRKEVRSFGPLPINYGNVNLFTSLAGFSIPDLSSTELSDMSENENFWRVAFSTKLNTPSEPLVQGSKVLVFLPAEQIEAEESSVESVASYYSYWVDYITEQSIQPFFLNNPKMVNRFSETFFSLFTPSGF